MNPLPTMITQNFTVLVRPEMVRAKDRAGEEAIKYVGQCVEFAICVQGSTLDELKERFIKSVFGHIIIAKKHGLVPFECLPPGNVDFDPKLTVRPRTRFPVTPPRNRIPKELLENLSCLPRGEVTMAMA